MSVFTPESVFPPGFRSVFIWPRSPGPLAGSSAPFFGLRQCPGPSSLPFPSLALGFCLPARRGPGVGPAAHVLPVLQLPLPVPDRPPPHCPFSFCSAVGLVSHVLQCGRPLTMPVTLCNCFRCILRNKDVKNNVMSIHGPITQLAK